LAGTTLCRFSNYGTPGPCNCLRAYQLPKNWGVPSLATPPRCSRGRLAPRAPSLGARAQCTAHAANGAPGPASCGPTRAHYAIPAPLPSPSTGLLHPSKWVSSLHSHQQQNDLHFVNLTNPLTHIILTPGSLGWASLFTPITHRTMHSTFTPYTQARWPHSLNMFPFNSQLTFHR